VVLRRDLHPDGQRLSLPGGDHGLGKPRGASGAKNFTTLLSEALNEPVIVTENGGRRKVTKRQAIITQLVNRSATADFRQTEPSAPETFAFSEADEKVLEQIKTRFSIGKPEQ
jgi:hypothetical protein